MTALPRLYFSTRQAYKRYLDKEAARPGAAFRKDPGSQSETADWQTDSISTDGLFPDAAPEDPASDPPARSDATHEGG